MLDNVGSRIKTARLSKGLSQQELARRTSVSQPTVANWENGSHAPRHAILGKVARVLDSSPAWLLGETIPQLIPKHPQSASQGPQALAAHHHIPVLNWPDKEDDLNRGSVDHYISATTGAARPIALIAQDADKTAGHFEIGSTLVFDRADTRLVNQAFYLVVHDEAIHLRRYISAFDCFLMPHDTDAALPAKSVKLLARAVMAIQSL